MKSLLPCGLLLLLASAAIADDKTADENKLNWVQVNPSAPWENRDSQGEVVHDGKLWIFGGWRNSYEAPPRDVWSSPDGKTWTEVTAKAPWIHSDLSMSITFQGKMYFMGGWYNGRLEGHSASNQVWSSVDGKDWQQVTKAAGWTPRIASAVVEFKDKIWILGGTENYYFGDQSSLKNDVWSSPDGKTWTQATAKAPWAPRAYHQAVVLNDRIYVFGGGNYVPEYQAHNDVWSSADGVNWRQETDAAPWKARLWFPAIVYRDRMWIMGGWTKDPYTNLGDVWYSQDGKTWHEMKFNTIWKARHEHSLLLKEDALWVLGGHAQPLNSEVWKLHIPEDYFEK